MGGGRAPPCRIAPLLPAHHLPVSATGLRHTVPWQRRLHASVSDAQPPGDWGPAPHLIGGPLPFIYLSVTQWLPEQFLTQFSAGRPSTLAQRNLVKQMTPVP